LVALDLELFVITNGRKTFDYVMRSIEEQSVHRKVTVIRDMLWVDALNECANKCQSSYYLRVDDDMVLHKCCVAYYLTRIRVAERKNGGVVVCRLWEDWSKKPVHGLRMYSRKAAKKLTFEASRLGKVDKVFHQRLGKIGKRQIRDYCL